MSRKTTDDLEFIESQILTGLISSTDFLRRVRPVWSDTYIDSPEIVTGANLVFEYFDQHETAPGRDIETVFRRKLVNDQIGKNQGELLEIMLQRASEAYEQGEQPNPDYLFNVTVERFERQHGKALLQDANDLFEAGEFEKASQCLHDYAPLAANGAGDAPWTLADVYETQFTEPTWLIKDLIPKGLTIVAGRAKIGKSQFVLNLCLDLALRRRVFDAFRGQGGPMLLLSLEDPFRRLSRRLHAISELGDDELERLRGVTETHHEWPALDKGGRAALEGWLKRADKPKLITIDTVAKVWSKKPSTSASGLYAEDRVIFDPLAALAHRYDTSIFALHHTTKSEAKDPFNQILGGMGVQGAADNLIMLLDEPGVSDRVRVLVRCKDSEERDLLFDVDGYRWTYAGERGVIQASRQRQALYDLVAEAEEGMSYQAIVDKVKARDMAVSVNSIPHLLRSMVAKGDLEQPDVRGPYIIPAQRRADLGVRRKMGKKRG